MVKLDRVVGVYLIVVAIPTMQDWINNVKWSVENTATGTSMQIMLTLDDGIQNKSIVTPSVVHNR